MWRRLPAGQVGHAAVMVVMPRQPHAGADSGPAAGGSADAASPPDGLSSFVARVLDQLTLSAWLPAALLTASSALLVRFRAQESADVAAAVTALTGHAVVLLVLTVPALIVATLLTQAFSFEAIRALEGYWRRRGPASALRTVMIRRQVRRKDKLLVRREQATERAMDAVRRDLRRDYGPMVLAALEAEAFGDDPPALSPDEEAVAAALSWRSRCHPWDLARVDHLIAQEAEYPVTSRVLPTRLGNVIRTTEDELRHAGQDLEGFALRRRGMVPARVQIQHDQFRNRLDMYCTLVFVGAFLTALTPPVLVSHVHAWPVAILVTLFAALSATSYGAAIASARGYCSALKQMDLADDKDAATAEPS